MKDSYDRILATKFKDIFLKGTVTWILGMVLKYPVDKIGRSVLKRIWIRNISRSNYVRLKN